MTLAQSWPAAANDILSFHVRATDVPTDYREKPTTPKRDGQRVGIQTSTSNKVAYLYLSIRYIEPIFWKGAPYIQGC